MPDPQPPYLADAVARFRAAVDAAAEHGHRIAGDARAAGATFQRESDAIVERLRNGQHRRDAEPTAPDLRKAAVAYRKAQGLPVPEFPEPPGLGQTPIAQGDAAPARRRPHPPPDDEDFSQFRVMRPL